MCLTFLFFFWCVVCVVKGTPCFLATTRTIYSTATATVPLELFDYGQTVR